MISNCLSLLNAIESSIYNYPLNYTDLGIGNNQTKINQINSLLPTIVDTCKAMNDKASVHILRYQSQLLCASSNTFGKNVTKAGNIDGILDLRSMMQCGTCAVIPCLPGQTCTGETISSKMCPAGYYCPITQLVLDCPEGYFCPEGTITPIKCRSFAAYSCNKNSRREVVWIPLLIALLIILFFYSINKYYLNVQNNHNNSNNYKAVAIIEDYNANGASSLVTTAPITVTFKDITLVTKKTVRISGVSGVIQAGKFTAILGGSGAGYYYVFFISIISMY
jgi:hypothetical protein